MERHWYDKEPKKIGAQHFQLIRRLKEEYAKRPDWSKVVGWSVVPVVRPPATEPVAVLVRVLPVSLVSLIWTFTQGELPCFYVQEASLRQPGFASASRGARKLAAAFRGRIGSLGAIKRNKKLETFGGVFGKLVRVVREHREILASAVSAALDHDPTLNEPRPADVTRLTPAGHLWHCVVVHHRSRATAVCDSANERYFSLIHQIFDEDSTLPPHRIAQRLLLREGGVACVGGSRDELLVGQVADVLAQEFGKNPLLKRKRADNDNTSWCLGQLAVRSDARVGTRHAALREAGGADLSGLAASTDAQDEIREACNRHAPALLEESARSRLRKVTGAKGMQALPILAEDRRTEAKSRAPSTLQERLNLWLESDEGAGWLQSRRELEKS